jgi:uncharacterized protein (TIGR00369 family)
MNIETVQNTVANIRNLVHPKCVVCSFGNGNGLHLEFDVADDGSITATFQCDEAFEGYPGVLHGGVISSILDGAMGNCMFARGQAAVTVEMTTRFRHPVTTCREATVSARIIRTSHPLYLLEAEIIQDGEIKATAKGKFYDQPDLVDVLGPFS